MLGLGVDVARAHNSYDSSTPADNEVLATAPTEWVVTFTNDVPLDSASAEIISSDGIRSDLGPAQPGPRANVVRFSLPNGLTGSIGLRWKLTSDDGHVVSGRVSFTVDSTATAATTEATTATSTGAGVPVESESAVPDWSESNPAPEPVRWFVRLAVYSALLLAGGLAISELLVARGTLASRRGSLVLRTAGGVLALGSLLQLLILLGDIHGDSIIGAISKLGDAFDSTALGMTTIRVLVGAAVLGVSFLQVGESDEVRVSRVMMVLLAMFVLALAYTSHSRSRAWPALGIPTDVAHTAAVATWLGGLAVMVVVVLPMVNDRDALEAFRSFGRAATIAVPVIVVTGVVQTLRLHGGLTTLVSQTHGRVLLLKIVAVAVMLALANKSRRLNLSHIADEPSRLATRRQQLTRASIVEAATGGLVIAVTAALVTSDFG